MSVQSSIFWEVFIFFKKIQNFGQVNRWFHFIEPQGKVSKSSFSDFFTILPHFASPSTSLTIESLVLHSFTRSLHHITHTLSSSSSSSLWISLVVIPAFFLFVPNGIGGFCQMESGVLSQMESRLVLSNGIGGFVPNGIGVFCQMESSHTYCQMESRLVLSNGIGVENAFFMCSPPAPQRGVISPMSIKTLFGCCLVFSLENVKFKALFLNSRLFYQIQSWFLQVPKAVFFKFKAVFFKFQRLFLQVPNPVRVLMCFRLSVRVPILKHGSVFLLLSLCLFPSFSLILVVCVWKKENETKKVVQVVQVQKKWGVRPHRQMRACVSQQQQQQLKLSLFLSFSLLIPILLLLFQLFPPYHHPSFNSLLLNSWFFKACIIFSAFQILSN